MKGKKNESENQWGCGALYCKFNNVGECQLKSIILGERGECLINKPDIEKMEEQNRVEQYVLQQQVSENTEETRRIGFYDPTSEDMEETKS